jgi:hypothetical protein
LWNLFSGLRLRQGNKECFQAVNQMSDAGTLLSELDTARPSDGDLVDSILSDLNQSGSGRQRGGPPQRGSVIPSPSIQTMHPNAQDPAVATAHLIGHDHPTEADFQRMMMSAQGPLPFNAMAPQMQQQVQAPPEQYQAPQKNWQGQWVDELKQPILVAILVFVITLPAVHLLVSHYAPSLLSPGGNFTTMGNLARALVSGGLFWVLQRVIAPLLSI